MIEGNFRGEMPDNIESIIQDTLGIRDLAIRRPRPDHPDQYISRYFTLPYRDKLQREQVLVIANIRAHVRDIRTIAFLVINPMNGYEKVLYTSNKIESFIIAKNTIQIVGTDMRDEYSMQTGIRVSPKGMTFIRG